MACGGGVVTQPDLVDLMRGSGTVIWLTAELATLVERVGDGAGRPLLRTDPASTLERLRDDRVELYRAASAVSIATDAKTVDQVAREVVSAWSASSAE